MEMGLARVKTALGSSSSSFESPVAGAGAGAHHQCKLRTALEAHFVLILFQALVSTELDLQVQNLPVFFVCFSARSRILDVGLLLFSSINHTDIRYFLNLLFCTVG